MGSITNPNRIISVERLNTFKTILFNTIFDSSSNGLAPAASSANKTTAETGVGNYYLCADGKYRPLPSTAFSGATYESKQAASGGTDVSLCTTGEKYTWNNKQSAVAKLGSTTKPVYTSAAGTFAECSTYAGGTAVTLNGSSKGGSTASFYAPTSYGTSGYYLKANGSGSAPTWAQFPTIPSISLNGSSTTSPSFYAPTTAGTSGYYLKSNGSGAPTWASFPSIPSTPSDIGITVSTVSVTANLTNQTCSITGSSNSGKCQTVIYTNNTSTDYTVAISTSYKSPDGNAIELTCPAGGYCEVNYINVGGTIYARGL